MVSAIMVLMFSGSFLVINRLSRTLSSEQLAPTIHAYLPGYKGGFIDELAPTAQYILDIYGVLPSISLAQAILESDWGRSDLALESNNLYGIKGDSSSTYYYTQEFDGDQFVTIQAPFRSYASFSESMIDHAQLLADGPDWSSDHYHLVLAADNYSQAAQALQDAGYATDPNYAEKLIQIIEDYELYTYDY